MRTFILGFILGLMIVAAIDLVETLRRIEQISALTGYLSDGMKSLHGMRRD